MPMPFHVGVDTVLLGKLGLLDVRQCCQPLGITACLAQRPGLCRCRGHACPALFADPGAESAPAKGEAAVGSCTVLTYRITERIMEGTH